MKHEMDLSRDGSELDWLAFQYIAGELTADEATEFESRLAADDQACAAVSRAVELANVAAIALSAPVEQQGPVPVSIRSREVSTVVWTRRLAWMACGAAACLLLILMQQSGTGRVAALSPLVGDKSTATDQVEAGRWMSSAEAPELALAWAQARTTPSMESADVIPGEPGGVATSNSEDDSIAAPSWMLAAVAGLNFGMEEVE